MGFGLAPLPRWTFRTLDRGRNISLVGPFLLQAYRGGEEGEEGETRVGKGGNRR